MAAMRADRVVDVGAERGVEERDRVADLRAALGAHRHRHVGGERVRGQRAELGQVAPQRAAADREEDVVEAAVGGLGDGAQPVERVVLGGEPARRVDAAVEDRLRRPERRRAVVVAAAGDGLGVGAAERAGDGGTAADAAGQRAGQPAEERRRRRLLLGGATSRAPRPDWSGPWVPIAHGGSMSRASGSAESDAAQDADAADAVDLAVVGLHVERPAVLLEALDDVALPQRVAAVHLRRVQPRDQHAELALRARRGQRGVPEVVVDVDVVVVGARPSSAPAGSCRGSCTAARRSGARATAPPGRPRRSAGPRAPGRWRACPPASGCGTTRRAARRSRWS